ncbi:AbrB family transcriptional regulator [Arenibaculum pallidiluteum]|uniref:AbrB family transcriptional regulator n=1 Tax=Arenibaculum pallidiluteum TaxID=2812559 RepID=UPI001A973546|nr:AbrB family transcriptional regulator [Arenibaculum pallidiluteum]
MSLGTAMLLRRAGLALAIGTAGGALAAWASLPLAWMIGSMVACAVAAMAGLRVAVPPRLRAVMIMVLGVMLGSAFTPSILGQAGAWALSLGGLALYVCAATAVGIWYLRRIAGFDPVTAYFTAAPGGLNEMVLVGGAMGGDDRMIALVHSVRIMIVVMTIPFWFRIFEGYVPGGRGALGPGMGAIPAWDLMLLAVCALGAPVAARLRLPAAALIGPMLASAALHLAGVTDGRPPGVLVAAAQIVVGAALGCRFAGVGLRTIGRAAAVAAGLTVAMLGLAVAMALALERVTDAAGETLVLAYAPGGLAEMSLIALALHADVAYVSTHHVFRILMIVTLAPAVFRLLRLKPGG